LHQALLTRDRPAWEISAAGIASLKQRNRRETMDTLALAVMLLASAGSMVGAAMLCSALQARNKREARRELFGLRPGEESWP
jgi:hypothetical protein